MTSVSKAALTSLDIKQTTELKKVTLNRAAQQAACTQVIHLYQWCMWRSPDLTRVGDFVYRQGLGPNPDEGTDVQIQHGGRNCNKNGQPH